MMFARAVLLAIVILFMTPPPAAAAVATAASLAELFNAAKASEPNYLGSQADLAAAEARSDEATGALLPHIDVSASRKFHRRKYDTHDTATPTLRDHYPGQGAQVELRQPLWNYANITALREAYANSDRAQLQLDEAEQQLFARVSGAWFDLLEARDAVRVAQAREAALKARAAIAERGTHLGLSDAPQAADARSKYLQAKADALASELDQQAKLAALEQFVGRAQDLWLPQLRDNTSIPAIVGSNLDALLGAADSGSPSVQAGERALAAADANVSSQQAGRLPTLDLVARYGNDDQAVGNFPGQSGYSIYDSYVGLQLSMPIYAGGTLSAKVGVAIAQRNKARDELEATRRKVQLDIKTAYFAWYANRARAHVAETSVEANRALLQQASSGAQRGLKTEADVLEAHQHWVEARTDWYKACYEQLRAYAKLMAALGELTPADAVDMDGFFEPGEPSAASDRLHLQDTGS